MNDLHTKLLNKIKTGEIDMKPKWHFVLQAALLLVGTLLSAILAVYLLSLVLFALRQSGVWFAPGYGMKGFMVFVLASPWLLILCALLFLGLLYVLVKHYAFSYKHPLIYSVFGVFVVVLVGSFMVHASETHERIRAYSEDRKLPGVMPLYQAVEKGRPDGVVPGTIVEVTEDGFVLLTPDGTNEQVRITDRTKHKRGYTYVSGDKVVVFCERTGEVLEAFGIRPLDERMHIRPRVGEQGGSVIRSQFERPSKQILRPVAP